MTGKDAIEQWSDACPAMVTGGVAWINGNREPIALALSRHIEADVELLEEVAAPRVDWKAVVRVTPTDGTQAAFYLCVE